MKYQKSEFGEILFFLPFIVSGLIGLIALALLPLCLVEGFYWAIKTGEWSDLLFFIFIILGPFGIPWMLVNLVIPGIGWAFGKLYKLIVGD